MTEGKRGFGTGEKKRMGVIGDNPQFPVVDRAPTFGTVGKCTHTSSITPSARDSPHPGRSRPTTAAPSPLDRDKKPLTTTTRTAGR